MAHQIPHGRTFDADFMFTKLLVNDLDKSAAFYGSVFGLIEMHRVEAEIMGRKISEIVYQPTYAGGPMFILGKFHDTSRPANDELGLGFSTKDMDALLKRVEAAGGSVAQVQEGGGFKNAFVKDTEGHLVQISQAMG